MIFRINHDNENLICFACGEKIAIGEKYLSNEYENGYEIHVSASPLFGGKCK